MGQLLKQSTAANITVLLVDSADHVTGKTGLTLTIYATKAGGTPAAITPTVTELDSANCPGLYKLALTTTHTNTLGELELHVTGTGADPTDVTHQVVLDLPGVAQTGDNYARIGAPVGASISADIATRLATSGYTAPANSDITAIKAKTDNLPASPAATGDIPTANANADALLDRSAGVETGKTPRQAFRLMLAAIAGKISGAATTTIVIRDTNDAKNRITATVDDDGNRTAITYDLT